MRPYPVVPLIGHLFMATILASISVRIHWTNTLPTMSDLLHTSRPSPNLPDSRRTRPMSVRDK
ncbi:hypothetical protein BGLA2_370012 [Burkholderia gladioli]|nr:hypothetical protein BGLA2_370012 [Burkholderia gladioli]